MKDNRPARHAVRACCSNVEKEVDNVAVLHDILLTLRTDQPLGLGIGHGTAILQILKGNHLGADKAALKVGVDFTGGLRGLGALFDGPGAALILAVGQERDKAQQG